MAGEEIFSQLAIIHLGFSLLWLRPGVAETVYLLECLTKVGVRQLSQKHSHSWESPPGFPRSGLCRAGWSASGQQESREDGR